METRILTLFDDEDFFPQEEPQKKAKPKKASAKQHADADSNDTDEAQEGINNDIIIAQAQEDNEIDTEIPVDSDIVMDLQPSALADDDIAAAADKKELDQQILGELVQQDYTAFIHKEYPFDVQQAQVIKKDKEIKIAEPRAAAEDHEMVDDEVFEDVVPLPEWKLDKKYYTIGEVAQLFAVNTSHIRFWTNEFKLKPRTTRKGDRLYNPKDIAELRLIHHLVKEKKHTIKGAKEKLKAEKTGVNNKLDLKESLTELKQMLMQIKEQL